MECAKYDVLKILILLLFLEQKYQRSWDNNDMPCVYVGNAKYRRFKGPLREQASQVSAADVFTGAVMSIRSMSLNQIFVLLLC